MDAPQQENDNQPIRIAPWVWIVRRIVLTWGVAWVVATVAAQQLPPGRVQDVVIAIRDVLSIGKYAIILAPLIAIVAISCLAIYWRRKPPHDSA